MATFFRFYRGHQFASSALMDPISKTLVAALENFAKHEQIPIIQFRKGERKDDIAAEQRKKFTKPEGVVFSGKAQEKTSVFQTERRRNEQTGASYPWIVRSTAMVNQFYVYCLDRDFGPFFLKFGSYCPYTAKLCINGHEYAKQQLAKKNSGFEALDNGVLRCDDPQRPQASATDYRPKRSTRCCGNGCGGYRTPTPPPIARPDIVIKFDPPGGVSRSPKCWTAPSPAVSSLKK